MDASSARIHGLMVDACASLEELSRTGRLTASIEGDLVHVRSDLLFAAEFTADVEAADSACGMAQVIDAVLTRLEAATAAA